MQEAVEAYDSIENDIVRADSPQVNAVLVYVSNSEQLDIVYPNYSTNVSNFIDKVKQYMSE
ncbi:hypothetical protein [Bifidobacterium gallicum]|uniref:hypothetical protein n=1 Tax=Bifidobacterium gallicum TaxID=78342 RepID=UPI0011DCEC68|nr:hypothetical protein [Bifidobacterium gallicum]